MKIGDKVLVKALVHPEYIEDNKRKLVRIELDTPEEMIYTGYTFRQEGTYHGGRQYGSYFGYDYDAEPPYLQVEKTIKVLRVKKTERSNDRFALVEDVSATSEI